MKQVRELLRELYKASEDEQDSRFRNWAKAIDRVDTAQSSGYAFVGDFIRDGTVEVEIKPRLFLVASVAGSMKYHTTTYRVVEMDAVGDLMPAGIATTDKTPGWALRIRDAVAEHLRELADDAADAVAVIAVNPLAAISDADLRVECARRGWAFAG